MGNSQANGKQAFSPRGGNVDSGRDSKYRLGAYERPPKMTKAITFDDRRVARDAVFEVFPAEDGNFQRLNKSKRAITFDSRQDTSKTYQKFYVEDVLFRRYFNSAPEAGAYKPEKRLSTAYAQDHGDAVIVVDPFSTGAILAQQIFKRGYRVVCIWSSDNEDLKNYVQKDCDLEYAAVLSVNLAAPQAIDIAIADIKSLPWPVTAVIPGAETGVELSDVLSEKLGLRTNGTQDSKCRRNKYLMGEKVRSAGLRAVQQMKVTTWGEVLKYVDLYKPDPFKVIVKPLESAGSDDVTLCHTIDEVRAAFGNIMGKVNGLGTVNNAVLLQEYLEGPEYVVDSVSLEGVHKTFGVWQYDKRPVNGSPFVYFGMELLPTTDPVAKELINYQHKVLDALNIKNGPGHAEIKMTRTGPCLVEIGSRCHGGEGTWLTIVDACIGRSQVSATVDAYLDPRAFEKLPFEYGPLKKYGREVHLVSRQDGIIRAIPGVEIIKALPSFVAIEIGLNVGCQLKKTIDCFTRPGAVRLVHAEEEAIKRDYEKIRKLEEDEGTLFVVECQKPVEPAPAVVVVDPFSTGALLAKQFSMKGYDVICVYSDKLEAIAALTSLIPEGLQLQFAATLGHDPSLDYSVHNIKRELQKLPYSIKAVVPGAETGVLLADQLSELMGVLTNGTKGSEARRNKFEMGEKVRSAGVRAVAQKKVAELGQVEVFLKEFLAEDAAKFLEQRTSTLPSPLIVKPIESAGSDDVFLCPSVQAVIEAVKKVLGKKNGLGNINNAVLVQEYLSGTEYVVDTVSRDGNHKVCAVWEYDKRPINGANFVYFGMKLLPSTSPVAQELIEYDFKVLDALGIKHGPGHAEIKMTPTGPCLVEIGSRCHGGEGTWLIIAEESIGYSQVSATVDAFVDKKEFESLPREYGNLKKVGREVMLVSQVEGILKDIQVDAIRALPSFRVMQMHVQVGGPIKKTIDCFTRPGSVRIIHEEEATVIADYEKIRDLETNGLFQIS